MKTVPVLILCTSHAIAVGAGWFVMQQAGGKLESAEPGEAPITAVAVGSDQPEEGNIILRASSADFRAAWRVMLAGERTAAGEPAGNSINFFIDWCAVDPEGAVLGLRQLYAPRFVHNYLVNAVGEYGAELAEPLVEHFREMEGVGQSGFLIGRCLGELAQEDPSRVTGLLFRLPARIRKDAYGGIFDGLEGEEFALISNGLLECVDRMDGESERDQFFHGLSVAIADNGTEESAWDWIPRIDAEEGVRMFGERLARQATSSLKWEGLMAGVDSLDGEKRTWLVEEMVKSVAHQWEPGYLVPFMTACEENGHWEWSESVCQERKMSKSKPREKPSVFLDWAAARTGEAEAQVRLAVDFALWSDAKGTFSWIESQAPGAPRDELLSEAINQLAEKQDQREALGDWLVLIQDPILRAAAQRRLRAE